MISEYLGFDSDYIILGLAGVVIILLILIIVNMVQVGKLKKRYKVFMSGKTAKSLEDTILKRLDQVDDLIASNSANEKNIEELFTNMKGTFQKIGLVKYDAFHEMGGKLSFSLAMLNGQDDGFVLNAVHSREGCYTYIKEIVGGNSIIVLADEEQEALNMAKEANKPAEK
ncbi:DUF4446 family protein [Agathobacter sp.]